MSFPSSLSSVECYDRADDRWTDVASMNRERWNPGATVHKGVENVKMCVELYVVQYTQIAVHRTRSLK